MYDPAGGECITLGCGNQGSRRLVRQTHGMGLALEESQRDWRLSSTAGRVFVGESGPVIQIRCWILIWILQPSDSTNTSEKGVKSSVVTVSIAT
jgi:hypothetical protein